MSRTAERELYRVYERSIAHQAIPMLFREKEAAGIVRASGYVPQKEPSQLDVFRTALTQEIIAEAIRAFLRKHPFGLVVQYECGLSLPFSLYDNGRCRCLCLDSAELLDLRDALIPERIRETRIACDPDGRQWQGLIEAQGIAPVFVVIADRFLYKTEREAKEITDLLARRFCGSGMIFEYRKKLPGFASLTAEEIGYTVWDPKREIPYYSGKISSCERITHLPEGYGRLLPAKEGAMLELMMNSEVFAFANLLFEEDKHESHRDQQ